LLFETAMLAFQRAPVKSEGEKSLRHLWNATIAGFARGLSFPVNRANREDAPVLDRLAPTSRRAQEGL
jgi:hypothetical protein